MNDALEIVERKTVYHGFFRIDRYRLRHRMFDGGWSAEITREIFERGSAVGVLLYDPDRDCLVLVEQFRLAAQLAGFPGIQLEIVAGIVDEGDLDTSDVARRETQEETGLAIIGEPVPMHRYLTSPGGTTETVTLFCARVDSETAGGIHGLAAEHEDIRVVVMPYATIMRRLRSGRIDNGFTLLALHWLAANRRKLLQLWAVAPTPRPTAASGAVP
jgi:ADP-ribose pyrophosphatase